MEGWLRSSLLIFKTVPMKYKDTWSVVVPKEENSFEYNPKTGEVKWKFDPPPEKAEEYVSQFKKNLRANVLP